MERVWRRRVRRWFVLEISFDAAGIPRPKFMRSHHGFLGWAVYLASEGTDSIIAVGVYPIDDE